MASFLAESPAQHERDLRSEQQEWKRSKDASAKWTWGNKTDPYSEDSPRPLGKPSEVRGRYPKDLHNINKYARTTGRIRDLHDHRVRHKVSAKEEIDEAARSVLDYLPTTTRQHTTNPMDNILYSFDRTDSPGRPLTLEVFVKTTGREMEKFVEKEYEVIDVNGDMLKGRKARRNLRRGPAAEGSSSDELQIDEDGFELV